MPALAVLGEGPEAEDEHAGVSITFEELGDASLGLALKAVESQRFSTVISDFPRGPDSAPGRCELWNMQQQQRGSQGLQLGMLLAHVNERELAGLAHEDVIAIIKEVRESRQAALTLGFAPSAGGESAADELLVVQLSRLGDLEGLRGLEDKHSSGGSGNGGAGEGGGGGAGAAAEAKGEGEAEAEGGGGGEDEAKGEGEGDSESGTCKGSGWLVGVRDRQGCSALHHAAACGQHLVLAWLLAHGAAAAATCAKGMTALHYAAARGSIECGRVLLDALAESGDGDGAWQHFDTAGYLPLHAAAAADNFLVLKYLVEQALAHGVKAAAAAATASGECCIHVAAARGSLRCVEWLLLLPVEQGGGDQACAAAEGDSSSARNGWRSLFYAAAGGQIDVAKYLVSAGSDAGHVDGAGRSAAVVAAAAAAAATVAVAKLPAATTGLVGARRAQQLKRRVLAAEQRRTGCSLVQAWLCAIVRPPPPSQPPALAHITPTSLAVKWLAKPKVKIDGSHLAEAPRVVQELSVKIVQFAPLARRGSGVFNRKKAGAASPPAAPPTSVTGWVTLDSRVDALATSHVIARSHLDFVMPGDIPQDARELRLVARIRCGNGNGWGEWSASSDPMPVPGVLGLGRPGAAAPLGLLNLRIVEGSLLPLPSASSRFFFVRCTVASPPPPDSSAGDGSSDGALIIDRVPHKSSFRTAFAAGVACASKDKGVACFDPIDSDTAASEQTGLQMEVFEGSALQIELCCLKRGPGWLPHTAEHTRNDLWHHGMSTSTRPVPAAGRRLPRDDDYDGVERVGSLTIEVKQLICGVPAKDTFWPLEQLQGGGSAYLRLASFFLPSAAGNLALSRSSGLVPGIKHKTGALCRSAADWFAAERVAAGSAAAAVTSKQVVEFVVVAPQGAGTAECDAVDAVTPHGVQLQVVVPRGVRAGAPFKVQILQAAAAAEEGGACQVSTADGLQVSAVTPAGATGGSLFHVCVARDAAPCSASAGTAAALMPRAVTQSAITGVQSALRRVLMTL